MPRFLLIETSTEIGSVCISEDDHVLATAFESEQKSHSARIIHMIREVLENSKLELKDLDAIGYSCGPGSYTGLRIGLSTAKGLCFRLQKPLLALSGLYGLAAEARKHEQADFYIPMIDARRDEVYYAIYDQDGFTIEPPSAHILNKQSFSKYFEKKAAIMGNGSVKAGKFFPKNAFVHAKPLYNKAEYLLVESLQQFNNQQFADVVYEVPKYIKAFHGLKPSV